IVASPESTRSKLVSVGAKVVWPVRIRRVHLFEFADLRWFPTRLRDLGSALLQQRLITDLDVYGCIAPLLAGVVAQTGFLDVVDLCSGASGPWLTLKSNVERITESKLDVVLTDKYPNARVGHDVAPGIRYCRSAVDAVEPWDQGPGIRTLFTSFHHFRPAEARRVLGNAVDGRHPVCIFEMTSRSYPGILGALLMPLIIAIRSIGYRPMTADRILFTFVLPAIPLLGAWDVLASVMRSYTVREFREFTEQLDAPQYSWSVGRVQSGLGKPPVTYLIGVPART
ncbi:hypothetical protein, partial [Pseudonocardia sp. SCN 73-27]|uniref:hypothetical protein n=1 Tax=Pseudonocardia sp. SCN 73-27 TaxID=1660132 RepID=UPI0025F14FFC